MWRGNLTPRFKVTAWRCRHGRGSTNFKRWLRNSPKFYLQTKSRDRSPLLIHQASRISQHYKLLQPVAAALANDDSEAIVTEFLLKKGALVNERTVYGTATEIALAKGNFSVVKLLLAYGADVDDLTGDSHTLLQAASRGDFAVIKLLPRKGACVNLQQHGSPSALQFAASRWDTSVVAPVLANGAKVNAPAEIGRAHV